MAHALSLCAMRMPVTWHDVLSVSGSACAWHKVYASMHSMVQVNTRGVLKRLENGACLRARIACAYRAAHACGTSVPVAP